MSQTTRTVAVTGATGFVGRYVVHELLRRGHKVRALVRDAQRAARAFKRVLGDGVAGGGAGPELVLGHVLDGRSPAEVVRGTDACVHLIGIIRETRGSGGEGGGGGGAVTFKRMHVEATRAMVEACMASGVKRFVHMSALGVGPDSKAAYQRTKFEAEQIVRRPPPRSALDWTVFRPSVIHGAEGELVGVISDMASGQVPPWYFMPYFSRDVADDSVPLGPAQPESAKLQPIAVEDVAWCFAEALECEASIGEVYNLVGPETVTWPEMYRLFRDELPTADHRIPVGRVPGRHGVMMATVAGALGLGGLLPFDIGQAHMAMEDSTADGSKAREHLGLKPRPFAATVREYAARVG